ncbi:MAG: hypothetical protein WDN30_05600 [Pararobbsia sp.]
MADGEAWAAVVGSSGGGAWNEARRFDRNGFTVVLPERLECRGRIERAGMWSEARSFGWNGLIVILPKRLDRVAAIAPGLRVGRGMFVRPERLRGIPAGKA